MWKKTFLICLVLVLVLGAVFAVSAGGRRGFAPAPSWAVGGCFGLVEALDLTDDQLAKLKEIEKTTYEKTKEIRSKLQDLLFEIGQLRLAKNPDKAAIEAKMDQVMKLRKQLYEIQEDRWQKVKSILTKEQLEKLNRLRWGRRSGRGPGRMGPCRWW